MIKNLSILLLLAFAVTTSRAQAPDSVWHVVNSSTVPTNLTAMTWTTTDTGFFLTQQSDHFLTITMDGGLTFSTSKFPDSVVKVNGGTSHYLTFENVTGGMSWPTPSTGYIAGETSSDSLSARPTILKTTDAGKTWREYYATDTTASFSSIEFPRERVGYATASLQDLTYAIMQTTDSGKSWTRLFHTDTLSFLEQAHTLSFFDAKNGIIFAQGPVSNHLLYTTDQGASFHLVSVPNGSSPPYLRWNTDGSWIFAIDSSIYRSTDSGGHWTTVVPADSSGEIVSVAVKDSLGFAFRSSMSDTIPNTVLFTRNYGVSWKSDSIHLAPINVSMASDSVAYLLEGDPTNPALWQIVVHSHSSSGGGIVSTSPSESNGFSAAANGNEIIFSAEMAPEARTIQIMDILGRVCASVSLPSGASTGTLPMNELRPGGYFARLGNQVVKFTVWN